ncbi:MAG TPA: hypothetical protein VFQ61_28365 [Polyangiaceae bacterium]|nr:hypothetical protein [Polyangiaceae bacterium]
MQFEAVLITVGLLVGSASLAGCGEVEEDNPDTNSGGGLGASGVLASKALGSLDPAERAKLCDWSHLVTGGYGQSYYCPDGTRIDTDENQEDCLKALQETLKPEVKVTIREYEACINEYAKDTCDFSTLSTAPACKGLLPWFAP